MNSDLKRVREGQGLQDSTPGSPALKKRSLISSSRTEAKDGDIMADWMEVVEVSLQFRHDQRAFQFGMSGDMVTTRR
jgi:hypothetical protein